MFNITILDDKGASFNVDVVRYFKKGDTNYLIHTTNEMDESGYVKLYASKMIDATTFAKVEDENEWLSVKELIKVIVREIKEGALVSIEDLNTADINNAKVVSNRAFKLTVAVKDSLGANKKVFTTAPTYTPYYEEEVVTPVVVEAPVVEAVAPMAPWVEEATTPVVVAPVVETPATSWTEEVVTPVYEEETVKPYYEEAKEIALPVEEVKPSYTPYYEEDEETPTIVAQDVVEADPALQEAQMQHVTTLDELLGTPVVETPMATVDTQDLTKTVEELELKLREYEIRFEKIKDLLQ